MPSLTDLDVRWYRLCLCLRGVVCLQAPLRAHMRAHMHAHTYKSTKMD